MSTTSVTPLDWPTLYFIRHGQTDWNAVRRLQGISDIPLNALGQSQADQCGIGLKNLLEADKADVGNLDWFVSPLGRTRETLKRTRANFDELILQSPSIDQRLIELSYGDFEGALVTELFEDPTDIGEAWMTDRWNHRPANGENYEDLIARVGAFGSELKRPAVVVAHGGIARALRYLLSSAEQTEMLDWLAPQGKVMRFKSGQFEIFDR